jgi:hypothetical protein
VRREKDQSLGELNYMRNCTFQDGQLIVHSTNPDKIVQKNFLFVREKDEDELIHLVKYKVIE